jgi:hypothetical protein
MIVTKENIKYRWPKGFRDYHLNCYEWDLRSSGGEYENYGPRHITEDVMNVFASLGPLRLILQQHTVCIVLQIHCRLTLYVSYSLKKLHKYPNKRLLNYIGMSINHPSKWIRPPYSKRTDAINLV